MPLYVVDADNGLIKREGHSLGVRDADEQGTNEAGADRHCDTVNFIFFDLSALESFLEAAKRSKASSGGRSWTRDELYERGKGVR